MVDRLVSWVTPKMALILRPLVPIGGPFKRKALAPRLFRIVYTTETQFRLMERAADDPILWRFNFIEDSGEPVTVFVRDLVSKVNDVPWHRGLELQVDVPAADLEAAISSARNWAEAVLTLLSAAGRASASPAEEFVGYEITPGVREREFAQWYRDLPILVGKTPITQDAFGSLFNPLLAGGPGTEDDRLKQRLMLSLSWHRQAMSHTDSLFRFLILWLAFESLTPLLTELYDVDPEGFQGLRALAEETGEGGSDFITQVLGLRRDLFHTRRVPVQGMKDRATEHIPRLQRLLVLGWLKLLGRPHTDLEMFPDEAVVPYPARLIAFARIFQEDASVWGPGHHPHFEGRNTPVRVDTDDPRDVGVTYETNLTVRNAEGMQLGRLEIRGPHGPNVGTWEQAASPSPTS
jgi:hypothetical protein